MADVQGQHGGNSWTTSLRQLVIHKLFAASTSKGFSCSSVNHSNSCLRHGRIRIILPDLDQCQFQAHVFLNFSPKLSNMLSKILKIMTSLLLMKKENHCKLVLL
jgi:hypothetical protein